MSVDREAVRHRIALAIHSVGCDQEHRAGWEGMPADQEAADAVFASIEPLLLALDTAEQGCPAIGPSHQECIGRAFWHEVHADRIGTTWRDWAGMKPGIVSGGQS